MNERKIKEIIEKLIDTFMEAGKVSLDLRKKGLKKQIKSDNTPVSNGDLEVNRIVTQKLLKLTPDIPIVSEETSHNKSDENLKNFWLVDPIDGTHNYVNNKDEFTINAALIINNSPLLGIINAPSKKRLFYTYGKKKSYEINENKIIELNCKKKSNKNEVIALVYSHNIKPEILKIHKKNEVTSSVKMSSSLKFCVMAAGEFDLYAADPRALEWDIAAGHTILKNAGGIITDFEGNEILYGKKNFKNPSIILKRSLNLNE